MCNMRFFKGTSFFDKFNFLWDDPNHGAAAFSSQAPSGRFRDRSACSSEARAIEIIKKSFRILTLHSLYTHL